MLAESKNVGAENIVALGVENTDASTPLKLIDIIPYTSIR